MIKLTKEAKEFLRDARTLLQMEVERPFISLDGDGSSREIPNHWAKRFDRAFEFIQSLLNSRDILEAENSRLREAIDKARHEWTCATRHFHAEDTTPCTCVKHALQPAKGGGDGLQ